MKIDQHPFPTNMLDAKGKTKVLTSEAAEKSVSVDPQHQVTTHDAKGKGFIKVGSSCSDRPPRSGVVITHRRQWETWQQREDRYRRQQEDRRQEALHPNTEIANRRSDAKSTYSDRPSGAKKL